jgi:hypothetical protein
MTGARRLATLTALTAWSCLLLQLAITLGQSSLAPGLWLYLGFFTILTNILVAISATGLALGRTGLLSGARARMAVTAAIVMVGVAYWLLLAGTWKPQGWQLVVDIGLHTLSPLLMLVTWFGCRDGSLRWANVWLAAIWPAAYAVYALARGQLDGWYAYWFFDPNKQSWGEIALSVVGLSALVVAIAAVLVAVDRRVRA